MVESQSAVRIAEHADLDACLSLALVAAAGGGGSADPDGWRGALGRDIDDPHRLLVVATRGQEIVGYARAHLVDPGLAPPEDAAPAGYYLIGLFVTPDRRRTGLGAALTASRLEWIAERANEAWFFTEAQNTASIELHQRFGFEEVTRRFSFGRIPPDSGHILYRARLPG